MEAAERRRIRCVWVSGGQALTEEEAAVEILSEARFLLQEDLARLGVCWDPAAFPPESPSVSSPADHPNRNSDTSSSSYLSPHDMPTDSTQHHQKSEVTTNHREEGEKDVKSEKRMAEGHHGQKGGGARNVDNVEPETRPTASEVSIERIKERINTSVQNRRENSGCQENRALGPKEGETRKISVLIRQENHQLNHPAVERSLTQELAEIISSPLPQLVPQPQPSPPPAPPPRFRAPISRLEQQQTKSTSTVKGECLTRFATSPLQPGRLKHTRALSKVLQSIQTDKSLQDKNGSAETSKSKPTVFTSGQNSAPLGQVHIVAPHPGPVQQNTCAVPAPSHADMFDSPPSVPPVSIHVFSPQAKRRRIDAGEVDKFSSPELYAGDKTDEETEGQANVGEESFGDSFELDTQTEIMIAQQKHKCTDQSDGGANQLVELQQVREDERVEAAVEQQWNPDERRNDFEGSGISSPRFNNSVTDSQMELILNASHQISPGPVGSKNMDKDEEHRDDELPDTNQAAPESPNRSSSFLFDSMYDSPLLAAPRPHQVPNQSDEDSASQEVRPEFPLPSTHHRRRSELLANQKAEEQEAVQWGESFFNLSEWGDSLLVGEHFLERRSLLRHSERTEMEEEVQQPYKDHNLCEEQLLDSQSGPCPIQLTTTTTRNEYDEEKAGSNQVQTKKVQLFIDEQVDPGERRERVYEVGEIAKQVQKKTNKETEKEEEFDILLSDIAVFKNPHIQNAPESALHCSPGLQEIFDRWPSMSDQPGPSADETQAAFTRTTDGPAGRKKRKSQERGAAKIDSQKEQISSQDSKNLTERPGSAGDLIPPTQENPPVTPRVKLTTSSVQSPVTPQPLQQSTPSNPFQEKLTTLKCPTSHTGNNNHLSAVVSAPDSKKEESMLTKKELKSAPCSSSKRYPSQNLILPTACASPPSPQPKPPSDAESPEALERFTLQLSQDASLCSGNSGTFSIIDVASDKRLFGTFIKEWKTQKRFSLALACKRREHRQQPEGEVGGNHKRASTAHQKPNMTDGLPMRDDEGLVLIGLSVCWGARDAYYISLQQEQSKGLSASLAPPPLDNDLPVSERLEQVKVCLSGKSAGNEVHVVVAYDIIKVYKTLVQSCNISLERNCEDPKVACWLLDPGSEERTLPNMVTVYCPEELPLLDGLGNTHSYCPRVRAATKSVLIHAAMNHLTSLLEKDGTLDLFRRIEMPSQVCLALLELNGVGFSVEECERQKHVMQAKLSALESEAYSLAGHSFSLTSVDDIAQVLFLELHLPPNGDVGGARSKKTLGYTRRGGGRIRLGKQFSTTKDILEKLRPLHPLPGVILEWRRITNALTKVVFPLQRERHYHPVLEMDRIYPTAQTHTATGRVSFTEPNIQNVPKDFEICMPSVVGESPPSQNGFHMTTKPRKKRRSVMPAVTSGPSEPGPAFSVSMRHAFIPFSGGMILAADYSQLELRVLAHLSKDQRLLQVLNGGADVFRCIAAEWKSVDPESVQDSLRQQAKQICYGIIYGMGAKSLGEQMGVEEYDAACYIESFRARYKGINAFLKQTVKNCRKDGYVQTLMGRRRYLAGITSTNTHIKAHAERQAVNTTVQGSAADIVKLATVNIQKRLQKTYPAAALSHQHTACNQRSAGMAQIRGAYFVLQLHDELIYETTEQDLIQVAQIVKREMETAVKLYVKLKAKVKVGPSWGNLQDLDI